MSTATLSRALDAANPDDWRRLGWPESKAGELADLHLALQAKQAAADHAARAARIAAEAAARAAPAPAQATLPTTATGRAFGRARNLNGDGQPRAPLVRLALAALVSCLLLLTACGGGGDGPGGVADGTPDVPTPSTKCHQPDGSTAAGCL